MTIIKLISGYKNNIETNEIILGMKYFLPEEKKSPVSKPQCAFNFSFRV